MPELMAVVPPPVPVAAPAPVPEIGFGDSLALRVCMLAAAIGSFSLNVLSLIPLPLQGFAWIALLGLTGVLAVILYRRRGGGPVTVLGGARLGWIAGVFCFLILLVLFTLGVVLTDGRNITAAMQMAMKQAASGPVTMPSQETTLALGIVGLLFSFVTISMMASVGGALGAKYFGHRQSS